MKTSNTLNIILYLLVCGQKTLSSAPDSGSSSSSTTPIELDLGTTVSPDYDYKKDVNMLTYTPRSGKIFNLVKEAGTTIWSGSDASNYSDKVEVDLITNENKAVTVHLPNNKTNVYRKHGRNKPWRVIDTSKTNPQSVNIKYKYNSYFYINTQTSDGRRFEAKNGFAFNVVNEYINNNRVEIWKTDDEKDFAKKVEVEGNKVTIYIGEGTNAKFLVFNKGSDDSWSADTSSGGQSVVLDTVESLTFPDFSDLIPPAQPAVPTSPPALVVPATKEASEPLHITIPNVACPPLNESVAKPAPKSMTISIPIPAGQPVSTAVSPPGPVVKPADPEQPPKITVGLNPFKSKLISVPMWSEDSGNVSDGSASPGTKIVIYNHQTWKSAHCEDTSNLQTLFEELTSQQNPKVASAS